MTNLALVWFRRDLRLTDHAALFYASQSDLPVVPLFILDDQKPHRSLGGASRWWLHHSLQALAKSLQLYQQNLILKRGTSAKIIETIFKNHPIKAFYAQEHYDPAERQDEGIIKKLCDQYQVAWHFYPGDVLLHPDKVKNSTGGPFRVYGAFRKTIFNQASLVPLSLPKPKTIPTAQHSIQSERLDDWQLLPTKPDWANGLRETWQPGEIHAHQRLEDFLASKITDYKTLRDRPDQQGTSTLSPYLHFGEISLRAVWHKTMAQYHLNPNQQTETFLQELIWRQFNIYLLYHYPWLPERPMDKRFAAFVWHDDATLYKAWCRGQTGYPLVDAGMRELWHTGWMHNRVRMVVASFLVKDLLIHWQDGEKWFWDTLVDADLANNVCNWQWVAGCGVDAAPYFRIFNPTLQAQKFDLKGSYIRKWVPELASLPASIIHTPWKTDLVGKTYPYPIIDHNQARDQALAVYNQIKKPD